MKKLSCLVIEDSLAAQRIIESYIAEVPFLSLVQSFLNPIDALEVFSSQQIDLLFLDVQLPKISGLDFIKSISNPPHIILTTAFSEYAVEGFELNVTDYLLKPFSFDRFLKAVMKVDGSMGMSLTDKSNSFFIKEKGSLVRINYSDIVLLESKGDYTVMRTNSANHITNLSLAKIISDDPNSNLLRCHKSFAVNKVCVDRITGSVIVVLERSIPIGRTYKKEFYERINLK